MESLTNAVEFTPEDRRLELRLRADDSSATIVIRDSGKGTLRMMSKPEWHSTTTIRYGHGEGLVVLEFLVEVGRFEHQLPGALPRTYDATSFEDVHRLKDRLEATLASSEDIRGSIAFIDRHATPNH